MSEHLFFKALGKSEPFSRKCPAYLNGERAKFQRSFANAAASASGEVRNKFGSSSDSIYAPHIQEIELATHMLDVTSGFPWDKNFSDEEDYYALHRWTWLLKALAKERPSEELALWGIYWMTNWVHFHAEVRGRQTTWDAYTAGERVANAVLFLYICQTEFPEHLKYAMIGMVKDVVSRMEYYKENTFNHILNNARSLYLYGTYFDDAHARHVANSLLTHELRTLVTPEGFLREGSSHYHFLITRWLLEIYFFAYQYKDIELMGNLKPTVEPMIDRCQFFLVSNENDVEMPLVGDVSPDCSPDWLYSIPTSVPAVWLTGRSIERMGENSGWADLFTDFEHTQKAAKSVSDQRPLAEVFVSSGWFRFNLGEASLFIYVRPSDSLKQNGHFHCDSMSFCLYVSGVNVLGDPGRFTYTNDRLGPYGVSAHAHNSIVVDGEEPIPFVRSSFIWQALDASAFQTHVEWHRAGDALRITLSFEGFSRLNRSGLMCKRDLVLDAKSLEVVDSFSGKGPRSIKTFFQMGPDLKCVRRKSGRAFSFYHSNRKLQVMLNAFPADESTHVLNVVEGDETIPAGWYFQRYGQKTRSTTLVSCVIGETPLTNRYQWNWVF